MITIDVRCSDFHCSKDIYRMVGRCRNCETTPILILITVGHEATRSSWRGDRCPVCACNTVYAERLATDDEVPAA